MRYYVVADIHGFYSELIIALTEKGFFKDESPHKLIVCGDACRDEVSLPGLYVVDYQVFVDLIRLNIFFGD